MKGFPNKISTKQDLFNLLSLVQAGEINPKKLKRAIKRIEARGYIACPIMTTSEDGKTIGLRYCSEATAGQKVQNANNCKILKVDHISDANENQTKIITLDKTIITLSKALSKEDTILYVPSPISSFEELGVTEDEINSIKGVLNQYE